MNALKEFAQKLNGVEYREIPDELIAYAKENGIVIVCGASDDLCELEGALHDEFGCYEGGTGYLDEEGNLCEEVKAGNTYKRITAIWCGDGDDGFTWTYNTDIPHEDFEMFDEDEKYCRGFVFYLNSLKTKHNDFLRLVKENPDLPIVAAVDADVVGGEGYSYWFGAFGAAEKGAYVCVEMCGESRFFTKDDQEEIEEYFADEMASDEEFDLHEIEIEKLAHEKAEALPWVEAIIVRIGLPEV